MPIKKTLYLAVLGTLASAAPVGGQQLANPSENSDAVKVQVTGSRIARIDAESALPLQVIGRDEIERAGWTTAAEVVAHLSASMNGWNDQLSVGSDDVAGKAFANLRNLGAPSTLVLLNGRRLANYAYSSNSVDLNAIPLAAINRVEVLKDGASSIYGSDAIAGVINFITRQDYRGFDAILNGEVTQQGGDAHQQVSLSGGIGDLASDRFNAFLTLDWQKDSGLPARDRAFSRTNYRPDLGVNSLSSSTFPSSIYAPNGFVNPSLAAGCSPPSSLAVVNSHGVAQCQYDPATALDDIPPTERVNILGRATFALSPDTKLYAEYLYTWNDLLQRIAPSPINSQSLAGEPLFYPLGGPYYPTDVATAGGLTGDLALAYRTVLLGPRTADYQTNAQRVLLGVQGELAGWTYDAGYVYSENTAHTGYVSGYVSTSALTNAMSTGLVNPFGPSGAQGDTLLQGTQIMGQVRQAKGTTSQIDGHASRELFALPGGPTAVAFGAEARQEKLSDDPSGLLASGDVLGGVNPIQSESVSRTAGAVYAEAILPLTTLLEAQISLRYDHYSDFGGTTNPKVALRWQPMRSLLLRGSIGTGFRAPTLKEAYEPRSETFDGGQSDPVRCPVTNTQPDCELNYVDLQGGNRALQPEKSTQYNVGIVWEPMPGNSITFDYWNIDKRGEINTISNDVLLGDAATYAALGATNVIRGPVDPAYPDLPGPIVAVVNYPQNLGTVRTAGVDVDAIARSSLTSAGRLSFRLNGTFVTLYKQSIANLPVQSGVGNYSADGPLPRWKHYGALTWDLGPWSATTGQTLQTGYTGENFLTAQTRHVASYSVWDLQGTYAGFHNVALTVGMHNLFNRDPPPSNQTDFPQTGYDPSYADPRGASYYVRIALSFK